MRRPSISGCRTGHDLSGADHHLQPTAARPGLAHPRDRFERILAEWTEPHFPR